MQWVSIDKKLVQVAIDEGVTCVQVNDHKDIKCEPSITGLAKTKWRVAVPSNAPSPVDFFYVTFIYRIFLD